MQVPVGKKVLIEISNVMTEDSKDIIEVYDGVSHQLITTLSGLHQRMVYFATDSNIMDIRFISDGQNAADGFQANLKQTSKSRFPLFT